MSTAGKAPEEGERTDELAALKADFDQLREDVAAINEGLRTLLQREQAAEGRRAESGDQAATEETPAGSAGEEAEDEWQILRDRFEETRRHGEQTLDDLEQEVVRHPLASLALAFGVGYLYARMTHLFR